MRKEMTSKPIATASNTTNIQAHIKQDDYVIEAWSCLVLSLHLDARVEATHHLYPSLYSVIVFYHLSHSFLSCR